jgi:hypothetical protein
VGKLGVPNLVRSERVSARRLAIAIGICLLLEVCADAQAQEAPVAVLRAPVALRLPRGAQATNVTRRVRIKLPAHARQGTSGWWYLVKLRALVESPRGGSAPGSMVAGINDHAAIQWLVEPRSGREAPGVQMLDLINGESRRSLTGGETELEETNYAQYAGLSGGQGWLTFEDESLGAPPVAPVVIVLPGSGVYRTHVGPTRLVIRSSGGVRVRDGARTHVEVRIENLGRAVRPVHVSVAGSDATRAVGPVEETVRSLGYRQSWTHWFALEGSSDGKGELAVTVNGALSNERDTVPVTVVAASDGSELEVYAVVCGVAVLLLGAIWRATDQRDRRSPVARRPEVEG